MEKPLTTTGYAVLGLLAVRPWTTYELAKQVQRSLGWFWPRAERKLYDVPPDLVARGLATVTEGHTGRRARSVYRITAGGATRAADVARPPTAAADVGVRGDGQGVLRRQRLARASPSARSNRSPTPPRTRRLELLAMIEATDDTTAEFGRRLHINALALRFHLDYEALLGRWAAWARSESASWPSVDDPGSWRWRDAVSVD